MRDDRLSRGKKESASSINVPVLLKLMAHSMREKGSWMQKISKTESIESK